MSDTPIDRLTHALPPSQMRVVVPSITPADLRSALAQAARGQLDRWVAISRMMLIEGTRVRSAYDTFVSSVSQSEMQIEPASRAPQDVRAAEFLREILAETDAWEQTLETLLHGEGLHAGAVEHEWRKADTSFGRAWVSVRQHKIMPEDVNFADDWEPCVRIRSGARAGWMRQDASPASWMIHVPGSVGLQPTQSGVLMAAAWPWLFSRWATAFGQQGLERLVDPILIGKFAQNSTDEIIEAFMERITRLRESGAMIVEDGQSIEAIQIGSGSAEWAAAVEKFESQISEAILGTSIITDADAGGNRALAQVQARSSVLPRITGAARKLARTLRAQWAEPTIAFNRAVFPTGAKTPKISFILEAKPKPRIDQLHVAAGAVTVDELRESIGLSPFGGVEGGQIARIGAAQEAPVSRDDTDLPGEALQESTLAR